MLAWAFRDLHGSRLHGFALLLTLGDSERAAAASGEALAAGAQRARTLRHPERAAAWLRARVLQNLRRGHRPYPDMGRGAAALAGIGVARSTYDGLAALSVRARAAFVASAIERFEAIDVEAIVGADVTGTQHLIAEARAGYLAAAGSSPGGTEAMPPDDPEGPLAARISDVAARAMTADGTSS